MRYLCHLDDPQKAQYDRSLVQIIGGLDYDKCTLTDDDEEKNANGQISPKFSFPLSTKKACSILRTWRNILITGRTRIVYPVAQVCVFFRSIFQE